MEVWKDIPGYEGRYQVSDLGRVRSVNRQIQRVRKNGTVIRSNVRGNVLKPSWSPYAHVNLGKTETRNVHQLVALAFLGACPPSLEVLHRDGDRTNNTPDNLVYGTHSENHLDITRHNKRKLTISAVHEIRRLRESGDSVVSLKTKFNVGETTIRSILSGESYAHV